MSIIYRPGEIPEGDAPPPAGLALGDAWLYPTREGFTRILERAWLPRLARFGIAVTGT